MGPVCNSKSEVSGDQVALLNGSCPIGMVFDLVEAESLGSPQTIPSGTYGSLFWTLCLTVLFVGLVYSIFVSLLMTDLTGQTMGTTPSSPLDLTQAHWKVVKDTAHSNSVDVKKYKWVIFCSSEWPSFNMGWPRE